jgi:small-conductance mechanosensitive channel
MEQFMVFVREAWAIDWVRALGVVLGSIVVAKVFEFVFSRVLVRAAHFTDTDLDDKLIELLRRPIFITVVAAGLYTAISLLALDPLLARTLRSIVHTVLIIVWVVSGTRLCSTLLDGLSRLANRVSWLEARTVPLFDNLGKLLLFGGGVYLLLVAWDLDVAPWLASAGVVGLAVGFAAKDSLANLLGGLFVIMDAPYKIGDYINLDTGERGQVVKIGLRSTRLLTRDDVEVTVPNGAIANAKVVNESGGPWEKRRVIVFVSVAYGSDVGRVSEVLLGSAKRAELIAEDPEPRVRFTEMGDSGLIFRVLGWIEKPELRGLAIHQLNHAIYDDLNAAGIEIPFPQRVIHYADQPPRNPAAGR